MTRKGTAIAAATLVISLAAAVFALTRLERIARPTDDQDALYLNSPRAVRWLTLGHTGLAANYYWTRAVQHYGWEHKQRSGKYPLLYPLLNLATQLDPQLMPAYEFGSLLLAPPPIEGAGQPERAVELVERGIAANPHAWRLYLQLGFIHYKDLNNHAAAQEAFLRGSKIPGAHPAMVNLAAIAAQERGDAQGAFSLWKAVYDTAENDVVRKTAREHLVALYVDSEVPRLEAAVAEFQARNGRPPSNWREMVASGWLPETPLDPVGNAYVLTPEGRVQVSDPDRLPYITQGLPPGYDANAPRIRIR